MVLVAANFTVVPGSINHRVAVQLADPVEVMVLVSALNVTCGKVKLALSISQFPVPRISQVELVKVVVPVAPM